MVLLHIIFFLTLSPEMSIDEYFKGNYKQTYSILYDWFHSGDKDVGNDVYGYFYALSSCDTHLVNSVFNNIINFYAKNPYRIDAIKENLFYYRLTDDPVNGIKLLDIIRNDYPAETLKPYYKAYRYFFSKQLNLNDTLSLGDSLPKIFFSVKKFTPSKNSYNTVLKKTKKNNIKKTSSVQENKGVSYYIQICALSSKTKSYKLKEKLKYKAKVVKRNGMYKVWVGPFDSYSEVKMVLKKIKKEYKDAFIVKEK